MRRSFVAPVLLLPALILAACAPTQQARGPDYSLLSGNYAGLARLGPLPARYELLLNINKQNMKVNGILTRVGNGNVYTVEGFFRPYDAKGGLVELKLLSGDNEAGTLSARVQSNGKLEGVMNTTLFSYQVSMDKVTMLTDGVPSVAAQPSVKPVVKPNISAPVSVPVSVPLPTTTVTVETTTTEHWVPVYVEPTPVKPARP